MGSHGPAVHASEPGRLLVELPQPHSRGHRVAAFIEALQSLDFLGITSFRKLRDGVIVDYDTGIVDPQELRFLLLAAFSKVAYALGDYSPSTHLLPVAFGGMSGPDLSLACVLLNTPEKTLIRRLCRTKHTVRTFSAPGASALVEVPWVSDWHQNALAGGPVKAVPQGSLTLSALGVTVTSRDSYTDELVVGRIREGFVNGLAEVRMGDSLWLRTGM